ncbi:CHAT domain-containing protein [Aquiflexum sp. TKW24L]|uniref:CHAT domain-containing protein n=1 Tax=Aquiflexum sp. TKW24L TaxID=2942212 RepID=UPI0020BE1D1F|nr:CHAT domain-containing protein [Aquiflexum sp. TKW24L]MCL6257477.1 CHAT domain-containing protein [Aquiflexum sp. TKW24L]
MKQLILGIARAGTHNNYLLNEDTRYISMFGTKPEVTFTISCGHDKLIEKISQLRYNDADPSSADEAISYFQRITSKLLQDLKYLTIDENDLSPLHIRLVATPLELAQVPFEFFPCPENISEGKKIPLLAHPDRIISLTREIRQETEANYSWPHKPRILFAWAQPDPKMPVPHKEHQAVLEKMVSHLARPKKTIAYPEPNLSEFLTTIPHASIEAIQQEILHGQKEERPYTHFHLLAHGGGQIKNAAVMEFRLLLCKNNTTDKIHRVPGESLAKALVPDNQKLSPAVVSLSVCDSGNIGNTILPSGSVAYQLHQAGIPCIIASQFPLTQSGSTILIKTLFEKMVNGYDPRLALYETRVVLKKEQSHDWSSMIAYARFPDDIDEQLESSQLNWRFDSMKVSNSWVDHIFKHWDEFTKEQMDELFLIIKNKLLHSIEVLEKMMDSNNESTLKPQNQSEHFGLLGSSFKRKAEFLFRWANLNPQSSDGLIAESNAALERAKIYYKKGFETNPFSHWNATQYLALQAISQSIPDSDQEIWSVTQFMATRDGKTLKDQAARIWAWGTLAELYLLKPLNMPGSNPKDDQDEINQAMEQVQKIAASDKQYNNAKESMARQLERYIHWWPKVYPDTFPPKLAANAKMLRDLLPPLEDFS